MSQTRCSKCKIVFTGVMGYACPHWPSCGPMETEGMVAPFGGPWLDPMPRQDLTLPPPAGYVTRADYDALAARLAEAERERDALLDGGRPLPFNRDTGGRMVREAWVRWAETQPNPKPSWLAPYDELSEPDKEADRQIAEAVGRWTLVFDAALARIDQPKGEV